MIALAGQAPHDEVLAARAAGVLGAAPSARTPTHLRKWNQPTKPGDLADPYQIVPEAGNAASSYARAPSQWSESRRPS